MRTAKEIQELIAQRKTSQQQESERKRQELFEPWLKEMAAKGIEEISADLEKELKMATPKSLRFAILHALGTRLVDLQEFNPVEALCTEIKKQLEELGYTVLLEGIAQTPFSNLIRGELFWDKKASAPKKPRYRSKRSLEEPTE